MKIASSMLLLLAAAAAGPAAADPDAKLDMIGFFTGKTHSDNMVKVALQRPHKLVVDTVGGRNKEGEFVLIDNVQEEGKPARKRTWVMHPVGTNRFTGVLSDAKGPVNVAVSGNSATIAYTMRDGGMKVVQQIQLQHDGTLANHIVAKRFGLKFAEVSGTIRKLD
jgi:hypothetical protein